MYDVTIDFGDNRVFNFRTWKGSERRRIEKMKNEGTVDQNSLVEVFVYGCMEQPTYLSDDECLYALYKLRDETYKSKVEVPFECECGHAEFINVDSSLYPIKLSEMGEIDLNEGKKFVFTNVNIPYVEFQEHKNKNILERTYIEMTNNCSKFYINGDKYEGLEFSDKDRFFDMMLPMHEFDELLEKYSESRFTFVPSIMHTCSECQETSEILVDYIEELLV